jgi:O-antigen biosynthesis protein
VNRLLIIGHHWPEPKSSAAGTRMMELIRFFKDQEFEIHFASAAVRGAFSSELDGVQLHHVKMNDSSFDEWVALLEPTHVLFDRFMVEEQFGWRVRKECPRAICLLDTEDLHCLRAGRQAALKANRKCDTNDLISDISKREIASIFRCDLSLIISLAEMEILEGFFKVPTSILHYIPFLIEESEPSVKAFEARSNFVSIGNFLHAPNKDAVMVLKETIWPLIRNQMPDAELHVYGAYMDDNLGRMSDPKNGFHMQGRAEDSAEVMNGARVLLAPLRMGAGLKGKLIEAMQCGTPNVTTSIGAEGMNTGGEWSGFIEDDFDAFATKSVELYSNQEKWNRAQAAGYDILSNQFSAAEHKKQFQNRLTQLEANIEAHRNANFIGSMLQFHNQRSTEFMGRWIEVKNASK